MKGSLLVAPVSVSNYRGNVTGSTTVRTKVTRHPATMSPGLERRSVPGSTVITTGVLWSRWSVIHRMIAGITVMRSNALVSCTYWEINFQ